MSCFLWGCFWPIFSVHPCECVGHCGFRQGSLGFSLPKQTSGQRIRLLMGLGVTMMAPSQILHHGVAFIVCLVSYTVKNKTMGLNMESLMLSPVSSDWDLITVSFSQKGNLKRVNQEPPDEHQFDNLPSPMRKATLPWQMLFLSLFFFCLVQIPCSCSLLLIEWLAWYSSLEPLPIF